VSKTISISRLHGGTQTISRRTSMDQSGQYIQHQRQLFQSSQLPPPSQLLPISSSYNRSNTLPPISSLPPNSNRYAYQSSPQPSSSNLQPSSQLPWPTQLSPREELVSRNSSMKQDIIRESDHHLLPVKHESSEDGMPSTSDFVKKLYKYVCPENSATRPC
jgi:osomolarity two-component system, response regulator SKN7